MPSLSRPKARRARRCPPDGRSVAGHWARRQMGYLAARRHWFASSAGTRFEVLRLRLVARRTLFVCTIQPAARRGCPGLSGECYDRQNGVLENLWSEPAGRSRERGRTALFQRRKRLRVRVLKSTVAGVCGEGIEVIIQILRLHRPSSARRGF